MLGGCLSRLRTQALTLLKGLRPKESAASRAFRYAGTPESVLNDEYVQCTECEYCMSSPYRLDIPGVFGHYNRIISAGKRLKSSNDDHYKEARRTFLIRYNRNVPRLRQANHCIGCEICKPHCSQTIDIPNEMRRIDLYAEQLKQKLDF